MADFRSNVFSNIVLCVPIAFCGIFGIQISDVLAASVSSSLSNALLFLGRLSMPIFLFHPIAFKAIGLIQVHALHDSDEKLPGWSNVDTHGIWGLIYLVAGLVVPILVHISYRRIKAAIR